MQAHRPTDLVLIVMMQKKLLYGLQTAWGSVPAYLTFLIIQIIV